MKYVAGTVTDWRHAHHHQPPPARPENTLQSGDLVPSDLGRVSCPLHGGKGAEGRDSVQVIRYHPGCWCWAAV